MFVANDKELGVRVTSLDPAWNSKFVDLRAWVTSGRLVCPGCKQKLLFRAGDERRPHFAHRVLSDCPLSKMLSPEVLESKAQLYVWLAGKYPGKVEMDVDLQIPGWDRFADLVVRPDDNKTFAYWVFDRSPRNRWGLLHNTPAHVSRNVLFTESALHKEEDGLLFLPAAQRDFIINSKYDPACRYGHLHFIDSRSGMITVCRGFLCVHGPNLHSCQVNREAPLDSALICPASGEIVYEEDVTESQRQSGRFVHRKTPESQTRPIVQPVPKPKETAAPLDLTWYNSALKCEFCGTETTDWIASNPSKGTCICRGCHPQSLAARFKEPHHE